MATTKDQNNLSSLLAETALVLGDKQLRFLLLGDRCVFRSSLLFGVVYPGVIWEF